MRHAGKVLNVLWQQMDLLFTEATANQAYATVVGELGPKSILLLLIGLGVGRDLPLCLRGLLCNRSSHARLPASGSDPSAL